MAMRDTERGRGEREAKACELLRLTVLWNDSWSVGVMDFQFNSNPQHYIILYIQNQIKTAKLRIYMIVWIENGDTRI